jgi:predicted RNA methylase
MRIPDDVLVTLSELAITSDGTRSIATITESIDRVQYLRVNKTLEALGGKWNRKAKGHVFEGDARARIDHAIVVGTVEADQDLGHFPTPAPLARRLVDIADVHDGMIALEPSAGTGRIVDALLVVGAGVTAIEHHQGRATALAGAYPGVRVIRADFMTWAPPTDWGYARVVMNPPFCKVGEGDGMDHTHRAFGHLHGGGVLVSVLPASVKFRKDRRYAEFRAFVADAGGEIDDLPEDSFKESGTSVRTVVVRMVRP